VSSKKIFLFDFDGVIVEGMQEYWHSSLLACERYLNSPYISVDQKLYKTVPFSFKEIRPWVKYGWEMILIVHEIIKTENPLKNDNKDDFINNYHIDIQIQILWLNQIEILPFEFVVLSFRESPLMRGSIYPNSLAFANYLLYFCGH